MLENILERILNVCAELETKILCKNTTLLLSEINNLCETNQYGQIFW